MRHDTVLTLVGIARGHDDHFAFRLGQVARLVHQRIVIREEGPEFIRAMSQGQIGRAHVRTPVTNAHLVCRLMLEKKKVQVHIYYYMRQIRTYTTSKSTNYY